MIKKLLLIIALFATTYCVAQVQSYRAYQFAYKQKNSYGYWTEWSKWQSSNVLITMNLDTDIVKIYSPKTQIYHITEYLRSFTDENGGSQVEFKFYDQDYDKGHMRLRIEKDGNSQIYIDFENVMWVYSVKRI